MTRQITEKEQAYLFESAQERYSRAAHRCGEIVQDFRIAETEVRLRFAGEALVTEIIPAFAHLVAHRSSTEGIEICLWDAASTEVEMPPRPCLPVNFTHRGNIWGFDSPRYRSAFHWGECSLNLMDCEENLAFFCVPDHRRLPGWVVSSPLRSILHWWMEKNAMQLVHAAAVGNSIQGALICGQGGAGKSSTALTCLLAGMHYVADDYLVVALDPAPRVHSLYATAKLDVSSLDYYPELVDRAELRHEPHWDKTILFLGDAFREKLSPSLRIDRVVLPIISRQPDTRLGPVRAIDIERDLAFETLSHLPHTSERTAKILARLSHEVPHVTLHLGTDRARIPQVIAESLEEKPGANEGKTPTDSMEDFLPTVSVIICAPDTPHQVRDLCEHVVAQGYPRTEIVIVNDGAGDILGDAIRDLPFDVHLFEFPTLLGAAEARNRGVRESFGELLAFLEPGDRWPPGTIERLVHKIGREATCAVVGGQVAPLDRTTDRCPSRPLGGALFRKSAFRQIGLFNPHLSQTEGVDWLRRAQESGLETCRVDYVTLRSGETPEPESCNENAGERIRDFKARLNQWCASR